MKIKHSARIISILLTLVLMLSLMPATILAADGDVTLTIIHVNDRHGRMGADPYISQLAEDTKGNVLILDAGDALHGQITANLSKGAAMVELMNEVGYSAMVAGNHEFTYGIERMLELSELADFPILAANVKDADGKNLFQSCAVFKMDGITVGIFGLATPETIASNDPRLMTGLTFDDPAETAAKEVAELKAEGCDIIIALTHLGLDDLSDAKNRSDNLAAVPGIDVIIDGHSHTRLDSGLTVGNTLIAQTGEYGESIGVVEITVSGGKTSKTAKLIPVDEALTANAAITAKIAELDKANEAVTGVVVGYTPVFLQGEKAASRTGGTNLADLITDSMRFTTGADMAFMSGGNIRASIDAGDITMGQVLTTLPYSNLLTTVELTGADILEILEHGVDMYPEAVGHYIHVSGMSFRFDPEAEAGSRVKTVTMSDGTALVPNKTYTVATIDFIAAGGDGYDMMANGKNLKYYGGDAEAFVNYLAASPAISAEPEGRALAAAPQTQAKDMAGHWAAAAAETCMAYGIMAVDALGNFNPNAPVTAKEACGLLDELLTYSDLAHRHEDLALTREALAVLIEEALDGYLPHEDDCGESHYSDAAEISPDHLSAVMCVYHAGLMHGVGGGYFDPKGVVTRAQMATVINNIIDVLAVDGNDITTFKTLADFEGARIGALTGTAFAEFIDPAVQGVKYTYYPSQSEMVTALSRGDVEAIALDMPVAKYIVAQNADLTVFSEVVSPDSYGFAFAKGSPLAAKANAVLQELKDNGTIAELEKIWFSADQSMKTLSELTYKEDYDGSAGTLRYGCDNSTEPMSYIGADGQPRGFDLDIIRRIAYELNMKVEFYPMGFDNVFAALTSGEVDMVGGSMSLTEYRLETYDCIGPYYDGGVVLVVKK